MDKLPYELLFSIAKHLYSPKDLSSFSIVSSLFYSVAHDDRIWQRLCYQLYNVKLSPNEIKQSFYDLFTKVLTPYGRYLGYWKSNEEYLGGLIHVHLNTLDGTIVGEKCCVRNLNDFIEQFFDDDDDDDDNVNDEEEESALRPVYNRIKLFTININTHEIFCHDCNNPHEDLLWVKTFDTHEKYFGLSQEALPVNERSSLVLHDHKSDDAPEERDIYFVRNCSDQGSIVYHPLTIPRPKLGENDHPLSRLNGIWVGTYGGHGLEMLHLEFCQQFICPVTIDGRPRNVETVSNVLVGRKITGDRNVPHSQISFAAVYPLEINSDSPPCYEGIGQIAHTNYRDPQFIRTKVVPISDDLIKVTWYTLYHSSCFKRCPF